MTTRREVDRTYRDAIGDDWKRRRQPKGRRAKSGQWWRRGLPPMTFMELADYSFRQSEKKAARMRPPEPMPDWRERVVIDEAADPIPMDVLDRCAPNLAGGTAVAVAVDQDCAAFYRRRDDGSLQIIDWIERT